MNPFTAVKDKFFATYLDEEDNDQKDNNHPHPQQNQDLNNNYNGNSLNSLHSNSSNLNTQNNNNHHQFTNNNMYSSIHHSSPSKPSSSSYTTHSKPYHSKKQQQQNGHHGSNIKQKQPSSSKIHSRSYQYKKKMKKSHKAAMNKKSNKLNGNNHHSSQNRKTAVQQRAEVIADYLEKVPLLARLSREDRYNLGTAFKQKIYSKNQIVIKQNETGHEFFIITKGEASVIITSSTDNYNQIEPQISPNSNDSEENKEISQEKSDIVATLHPGDYFGETALLTSKPRNATVKSNNNQLHCLVLDKKTFISVFGKERVRVNFGKRGVTFVYICKYYLYIFTLNSF